MWQLISDNVSDGFERNYGNAFPFIQLLNLSRTSSDNDEFVYSRPPIPHKQRKLESNAKYNANFYIKCDIEAKNKTAEFLDMVKCCQGQFLIRYINMAIEEFLTISLIFVF